MAQYLNAFSGRQFLDANGAPYNGAKLFVYIAGSSTKATVTKDSAGLSNHTNPIILNTRGEPADVGGASQAIWQTGGQSVKLVLAPSTDTDPPVAAISTWDNLSGINDTSITIDQWITGPTPTYVGATSFTLVGDQTSTFHIGRRIKTTNSGGTIYSTITNSAYGALTTVTVVNDSGVLDSGLTAVSYGILSSANTSIPGVELSGDDWTFQGNAKVEGVAKFSKGADIVSASALTLGADGNYFDVTGTTAITSIGTVGIGTIIKLHFDDVLVLTHHATDLILRNAANITTAAGDEAEFIEYATGDWRLTKYERLGSSPGGLTSGTTIATTSTSSITLSSTIQACATRITVTMSGVSTSGNDSLIIQLGDSGGLEATGYLSSVASLVNGDPNVNVAGSSTGVQLNQSLLAANAYSGNIVFVLNNLSTNTWVCHGNLYFASTSINVIAGEKSLSGTLTTVALLAVGGGTFDAGSARVLFE